MAKGKVDGAKGKDVRAKGKGDGAKGKGKAVSAKGKGKAVSPKGKGKGDGAKLSTETELRTMAEKARQTYTALPAEGRKAFKALGQCIDVTLSAGVVHFERALRIELETEIGPCELERQAGSQWVLSVRHRRYYMSVRSEVLDEGGELLAILKEKAQAVKRVLLDSGAQWLYDLSNGDSTKSEFLEEVENEEAFGERWSKGRGARLADADEATCPICWKSLSTDLLAGKHMCRIVATYTCCGKWTSYSGRYNLEEERIMGQRCKSCGEYGKPSEKWTLADASSNLADPKPHLSNLCEACHRYGNCRGAFYDPFQMTMAVQAYTGRPPRWRRYEGQEDLWVTELEDVEGAVGLVVLQPHISQAQAQS